MNIPIRHISNLDRLGSWVKFRQEYCEHCMAACCAMPVEVRLSDLVRLGLVDPFEAEHEAPKNIAKRLEKARVIEHFSHKANIFTLARRANGDCQYLDLHSRRCTVYEKRPNTCRKHPEVGPRPGYCAFQAKEAVKSIRGLIDEE
ncbi:YkgJ family cysteine cluster protein [Burkholderiaceae bacterium DAT-1]|nr:YkgJ family cysteine cluster protein [Burkholderiaceae bacterium DAT-1]